MCYGEIDACFVCKISELLLILTEKYPLINAACEICTHTTYNIHYNQCACMPNSQKNTQQASDQAVLNNSNELRNIAKLQYNIVYRTRSKNSMLLLIFKYYNTRVVVVVAGISNDYKVKKKNKPIGPCTLPILYTILTRLWFQANRLIHFCLSFIGNLPMNWWKMFPIDLVQPFKCQRDH